MAEEPKFGSAHWWAAQADSRSTTLADSVGCWKTAFELLEAENAKLRADLTQISAERDSLYGEVKARDEELATLKAKLEFLKEKGIVAGMMKTSDKPEPYMVYIIAPGSELDDAPMVMREIESAKTIATLEAEVKKYADLMIVPHPDGSQTGATPESLKAYIDELQGEWDNAEKRLAAALQAVEKEKNLMKLMEHQEAVLAAASRRDAMVQAAKICDAQAEFARTTAEKYRLDDERYSQWSARAAGLEEASETLLYASTAPTTTKE